MAESDLDIQAYQPAIVFINGEYWGIHELREANKNSWYYQYHHDINRDDPGYDILVHTERNGNPYPQVDEGDNNHWNAMMNYINTHDMNLSSNYEHLKTLIDIDNFITYMGHCIYVGKWDWPNNNDASWRPRIVDGKWKWIQYDMETSFGVATGLGPQYSMLGPQLNMLKAAIVGIDIPGFERYGPHPIMKRIYNNEEFKAAFLDWFDEHMDHEFHPDSMNLVLDSMVAEISPYMEEYKHRWPFIGNINGEWGDALDIVRDFNERRPEYMRSHLQEYELGQLTPVEGRLVQDEYKLFTNVLDPVSKKTSIVYQIPEAGDVVLEIYNTQGQKLISFNKKHTSRGKYFIDLNTSDFSNGLYLVTFKVDDFYEAGKMVLLK